MYFQKDGELEKWCPGCDPERDPLTELLLETYCYVHRPSYDGPDDSGTEYSAGDLSQIDPATNRAMNLLLGESEA